jgi:MoxR-like ATPase
MRRFQTDIRDKIEGNPDMEKTIAEYTRLLEQETEKIIVGKRHQIDMILMTIFSGGHVLLNDLPGSGKTTLVKTMSLALGCDFRRLQFTPDLLPSDIVGMTVFNQKTSDFQLVKGPVHTNLLLADEINRAIPRTQSALLEAMEEGQTTIDGTTLELPKPFTVLATQNPVERESTFQLPAAQMDRFFVCLSMGYPEVEEEVEILTHLGDGIPYDQVNAVVTPEILMQIREEAARVQVSEHCSRYIVGLVQQTRKCPWLKLGASPRASRSLYQGSKAYAAMQGRDYVIPEDIQTIWQPVMNHRVVLTSEARFQKKTVEEVLQGLMEQTEVPPYKKELFHGNKAK